MNLPEIDLPIYQMFFETEYSLEVVKEKLSTVIREFKISIEELQKCEFKVLDNITAEKLLIWLKFNSTHLQEETDELNKYFNQETYEIDNEYLSSSYTGFDSLHDFVENFKIKKREYERHKKIRKQKEYIKSACNKFLYAIIVKTNKHIPRFIKMLSFPDEYNKFKKVLPDMIKYHKETGKKVFFRGNLSKQFLKRYDN